MVNVQDPGSSGPDMSRGQGHCFVFLGQTLYSHSASLHMGVQIGFEEFDAGGKHVMD